MAYKKITDLQEATDIVDEDLLEVVTDTTGTPTSKSLKISTVEDWVKTFAAQESTFKGTIGNIMSPLLDLPLKNSLAMKAGVGSVHFERSTAATYVDRYGVVQTANIDEPRFEEEGLLIEGASTNLLTYSQEFDNVAWTKLRVDVTANIETAPDGTTTADKIEVTENNQAQYISQTNILDVTQDETYITLSWFVKKGNESFCNLNIAQFDHNNTLWGESNFNFNFDTKEKSAYGTSLVSYKCKELKNNWFKLTLTVVALGTDTAARIDSKLWVGDRSTLTIGQNIYTWGAQLEKLPFASSYIPTTDAAVTRAKEIVNFTGTGNVVAGYIPSTTFLEWSVLGEPTTEAYILRAFSNDILYVRLFSNGEVKATEGTIGWNTGQLNLTYVNSMHKFTITNNGITKTAYLDGVQTNLENGNFSPHPSETVYLGSNLGQDKFSFCHIKNLKIYDKCLTPLEVSLL